MKIGVITDIHNNLPALEAVLDLLAARGCSELICCGDILGVGPWPEQTVQRLMTLDRLTCVQGNHDRYAATDLIPPYPDGMEREEALHHRWEQSLLSAESLNFIRALPRRMVLERERVSIEVVHYGYTADGVECAFVPNPAYRDCESMFPGSAADVVLYGHNHTPCIRRGTRLFSNVGSLGCPHSGEGVARCGVLTVSGETVQIDRLAVRYDLEAVLQKIDRLGYPAAETIKRIHYGISR